MLGRKDPERRSKYRWCGRKYGEYRPYNATDCWDARYSVSRLLARMDRTFSATAALVDEPSLARDGTVPLAGWLLRELLARADSSSSAPTPQVQLVARRVPLSRMRSRITARRFAPCISARHKGPPQLSVVCPNLRT